ncbi:hypothetical protein [Methanocella sp. MCL-LM]|uniref:hypothetical protein n=1 Tax=Methanocella sp. MCL-LM TaxID=3412035 RepID=UPI003C753012
MVSGLLYAVNLELTSDHVVPGLVAMELFKNGNIQYDYPAEDPYLFTDIYTFYLIPQILTGFSPLALKLTGFLVFVLVLATFSYLVYRYAGLISALIFTALLANVSQSSYYYFLSPEYHVGTLLATGLLILLFNPETIKTASNKLLALYLFILGLVVLSDNLIIAYFLVPYLIYYLVRYKFYKSDGTSKAGRKQAAERASEGKKVTGILLLMGIISVFIYLYKRYQPTILPTVLPRFLRKPGELLSLDSTIVDRLVLYFQSITMLVSRDLFSLLTNPLSITAIAIAILFLLVLGYAIIRYDPKANYLNIMFLSSFGLMFISYVFTTYATDDISARFLILSAVSIFAVIALAFRENETEDKRNLIYLGAILLLLLATVPASLSSIAALSYKPNEQHYQVIDFLEDNNITVGYSGYDDANLLTYLSNDRVKLRLIREAPPGYSRPVPKGWMENIWLSSERWWWTLPKSYAVVINNDSELYPPLNRVVTAYPPEETLYFGNYTILKYSDK